MHTAGIFADMTVDGPEIGILVVVVDRAKNLPNRRTMGKQDPYCAARLGKEAKKTETDRRGGQVPKWDQELRFTVHDSPDYYKLKVSVFNEDKKTDLIGETWIGLNDVLLPGGGQSDLWHQLEFRGKYAGEIRIELTYYDTRPRAEKTLESTRSRARTHEKVNVEQPAIPRHGPREQPTMKRRPLPTHPNSSPAQIATPDSGWTTPQPQSGPRSFHTPPSQNASSSPADGSYPVDGRRSESYPEYQTPSRPFPDPIQAYQPSYSAPIPSADSAILRDPSSYQSFQHLIYSQHSPQEHQHDMTSTDVPLALKITVPERNGLPITHQNEFPMSIRHDRVHALSGANPLKMQLPPVLSHTYSTPQLSLQEMRYSDGRQGDDNRSNDPYNSTPRFGENRSLISQPSLSLESTQPYSESGYNSPQNRHNSAPPPPTHRYSAPAEPNAPTQWSQDRSPSFPIQESQGPGMFNRFSSRPEEHTNERFEAPPEYSTENDNPYHWQPSRTAPPALSEPLMDPHNRFQSSEPNVHAYDRRRSDDTVPQQHRTNGYSVQSELDTVSGSFPGQTQNRMSYDPSQRTPSHLSSERALWRNSSPIVPQPQLRSDYSPPKASVEADSARPSLQNTAPIIKPRALSPSMANRHQYPHPSPVIRKSVSPQSSPPGQAPQQHTIPFSPDSYDQFNPRASRSSPSNANSNPRSPGLLGLSHPPSPSTDPPRELETLDGLIITNNGRTVDPSDHLPVNSWAPEPERKNPAPATVKARLGPREAKPPSPRTRGFESQVNQSPSSNTASSTTRGRLQKRNPSGPLAPAEPNILNGSTNFSSPYPPPVPAKIPLYNNVSSGIEDYEPGGRMTALSREMEGIDIGPPKKASDVIFGGMGGKVRKSRFGL